MRYFGAKPYSHDASLVGLDCEQRELFTVSLEQTTRLKKDPGEISLVAPWWQSAGWPSVDTVHLSFAANNEYQALRETIPWEMGLLAHPVRDVLRNHKLSGDEKRKRAAAYGEPWSTMAASWLQMEQMLNASNAKHTRIDDAYWLRRNRERMAGLGVKAIHSLDHHTCHAASAAFHAPFDHGVVVTLDGWGNNCFSKVFTVDGYKLTEIASSNLTWTWGYLYGKVTKTLGYFINADEGKVEALASFAKPDPETLAALMGGYRITDDLRIDGDDEQLRPFWAPDAFDRLRDRIGSEVLAATIQTFLEMKALEYVQKILRTTGARNLACAGGIFANVKMNQQIFEQCDLDGFYIAPAMHDGGSAQGAAYLAAVQAGEELGWLRDRIMPYWGGDISDSEIARALGANEHRLRWQPCTQDELPGKMVDAIVNGKVLALCRGRSEFGPRALGHRSIIADPRGEKVKDTINRLVKRREWFQPFCPSILEEERARLFSRSYPNRHMTCAFTMDSPHAEILEGACHVDHTARPQFVQREDDAFYHDVLQQMKARTGYGVLVNTSFNLHGRAMVLSAEDAIQDFIDCGLDAMVLGSCWVEKATVGPSGNDSDGQKEPIAVIA